MHNEVSVTEDSKETPTKEDTEKKNDNDVQIILNLQKEDSNPIINLLLILTSGILPVSYFLFPTFESFSLFEYYTSFPALIVIPVTGVIGVIINILFFKFLKINTGWIPLNSVLGLIVLLIILLHIFLDKYPLDKSYGWWAIIGSALIMLIVGFIELQNKQIQETKNKQGNK